MDLREGGRKRERERGGEGRGDEQRGDRGEGGGMGEVRMEK